MSVTGTVIGANDTDEPDAGVNVTVAVYVPGLKDATCGSSQTAGPLYIVPMFGLAKSHEAELTACQEALVKLLFVRSKTKLTF